MKLRKKVGKEIMTVKNLITYLFGIVIIGFAGYYFYSQIFVKNEFRSVEYVHGKADTLFIPGEMKKTVSEKVFKGKIRVRKNGVAAFRGLADSGKIDSLSVFVREINLDSVEVNFDFRYFGEMNLRVDTLKIVRVDTVKVKEVIQKEAKFYRSFWFVLTAGTATALLIISIVK